jgi:hypothetical protein
MRKGNSSTFAACAEVSFWKLRQMTGGPAAAVKLTEQDWPADWQLAAFDAGNEPFEDARIEMRRRA